MIRTLITSLFLIVLCSCAGRQAAPLRLPVELPLNRDAGRGDWVRVQLRLGESSEELSFVLDTGSPRTILDKSLETRLGKRLGTGSLKYSYYGSRKAGVYHAPQLFLGDLQLQTGSRIYTDDLTNVLGQPMMGVLGMDCLRHYCVQMDFAGKQLRLLDPNHLKGEDLGAVFPLAIVWGAVLGYADFFGTGNAYFRPDTGAIAEDDAILTPGLFRKQLKKRTPIEQWKTSETNGQDLASFSEAAFGGRIYTNLLFAGWGRGPWWKKPTDLNLQFLARNLVTFNFPKRRMYLKQQSAGPLASDYFLQLAAAKFLWSLKIQGRLPGCLKDDQGKDSIPEQEHSMAYPVSRMFDFQKAGETVTSHYTAVQSSPDTPWKLQRAWQTDASGHFIKEYPLP